MRAHRLRSDATRLLRAVCSSRRGAALASAIALTGAIAALPSAAAAEECPNAAFRTGPSTHLPDCRAYEMVTPPFKGAGFAFLASLSRSGNSALMFVSGAFGGLEDLSNVHLPIPVGTYTMRRTPSGWQSTPDDLSATEYLPDLRNGFTNWAGYGSEDGPDNPQMVWQSRGVWEAENRIDFFVRRTDRSIADIGPALPPLAPSNTPENLGRDAGVTGNGFAPSAPLSGNASRYFFSISGYHWPSDDTEEGLASAYEYLGTGNTTPLLIGVDNSGKQISQCGTVVGDNGIENVSGHNAVSTDGDTVIFTAAAGHTHIVGVDFCKGSGPPVNELFARIDNGLPGAHTVAISEPSKEDCSACDTEAGVLADAHFIGASEDGSKVFFITTQPLLGSNTSNNLYEYDFAAPAGERVVRATAGDATVSNPAPGLVKIHQTGVLTPMNSEDGSHVYFIATGVLTTVPNGEGESAKADANNLYVFEHDARFPHGHTAFIASLSPADLGAQSVVGQNLNRVSGLPLNITPDGRFLVFDSERDLTPDDTGTATQLFEYDAQTGALARVLTGQDGFNHNGNVPATFDRYGENDAAQIITPGYWYAGFSTDAYWTHLSVSADGSYVFFQSSVGLTPQAFDRKTIKINEFGEPVLASNVYEYHAGKVSLISDGQDVANFLHAGAVELLGTDASGSDVFFQTVDPLVGQDTDTNLDVYDARIGGGFPAPTLRPSCSGDACQGSLSGAPVLLSPGSEFQAGGNPPLAGAPVVKPKPKQKAKPKVKKRRPKGGKGHFKRHRGKAKGAAVGGRANRKAGRS